MEPPVNGGSTTKPVPGTLGGDMPQWSPPLNGGSTREPLV